MSAGGKTRYAMAGSKRLIVGLGNPGPRYEGTRHNVGFVVLDLLAARVRGEFRRDGRARSLVAEGRLRGRSVVLVKPQLFVNRSGEAVRHLARRFSLNAEDILVVTHDIHLPVGRIRIRAEGSAAGHNGMQNIIDCMGSEALPRLRIGIGNDYERGRQSDYVLSAFTETERPVICNAAERARDAVVSFCTDSLVHAMNQFNRLTVE